MLEGLHLATKREFTEAKKAAVEMKQARKSDNTLLGGLQSRSALKSALAADPKQSDPATTDTTQEDPDVDSLQDPRKYMDVMRAYPKDKLKPAQGYAQTQSKV